MGRSKLKATQADTVLNQFVFILQDDATLAPVQIQVNRCVQGDELSTMGLEDMAMYESN